MLMFSIIAISLIGGSLCQKELRISGRYRPSQPNPVSPLANVTNHLGYVVFRNLPDADKIVSPISLLQTLALIYFGSEGKTKQEMDKVFQFERYGLKTEEKIEHALAYEIFNWKKGDIMDVTRAYSNNYIFESYVQKLRTLFDADIFHVNFEKESAQITKDINTFISQKTSGNIPQFFKQNLAATTKLVLLSLITFKFPWKHPFSVGETRGGAFYNNGKEKAHAYYMFTEDNLNIGFNEYAKTVTLRLPYKNEEYDMYIIGPYGKITSNGAERDANVEDIEQYLKATGSFDSLLATEPRASGSIAVEVPKFVVSSELDLNSILRKMGLVSLFEPGSADLTRMASGGLYISKFKQAGYCKINEEGTEAGVVTTAQALLRSFYRPDNTITFDKPFLFVIRNNKLHLNLFIGKISTLPEDD